MCSFFERASAMYVTRTFGFSSLLIGSPFRLGIRPDIASLNLVLERVACGMQVQPPLTNQVPEFSLTF